MRGKKTSKLSSNSSTKNFWELNVNRKITHQNFTHLRICQQTTQTTTSTTTTTDFKENMQKYYEVLRDLNRDLSALFTQLNNAPKCLTVPIRKIEFLFTLRKWITKTFAREVCSKSTESRICIYKQFQMFCVKNRENIGQYTYILIRQLKYWI